MDLGKRGEEERDGYELRSTQMVLKRCRREEMNRSGDSNSIKFYLLTSCMQVSKNLFPTGSQGEDAPRRAGGILVLELEISISGRVRVQQLSRSRCSSKQVLGLHVLDDGLKVITQTLEKHGPSA